MLLTLVLASSAPAAEVVWLAPPSDTERATVGALAGASGSVSTPAELRAAVTRWTEADEWAVKSLGTVLEQVRTYETELDGELRILRGLDAPIAAVTVLRDDSDRAGLFAALAYQGFAVHRYWGRTFETAIDAQPYQAIANGEAVDRPWLDAIGLDTAREATPYDIAEAPQRVAYNALRTRLLPLVPATVVAGDVPPSAQIVVDGRRIALPPSGRFEVPPGRHFLHLELDGEIIGRLDVRAMSGETLTLAPYVPESEWAGFVADLSPGTAVPPRIGALVQALGGEVWLATPGDPPTVLSVSPTAVREVRVGRTPAGGSDRPVELSIGALGGWLSSGDFYSQDALRAPHALATVNSAAIGGFAAVDLVFGPARLGAGLDLLTTPGAWHVALTGDRATRLRPVPHLAVGVRWAQLTGGFLFPYHLAGGARLRLPVGPFEGRVSGWYGTPFAPVRANGSLWDGHPVYIVAAGAGARF